MDSADPKEGQSSTELLAPKDRPRLMRRSSSMYLNVRMPQKPDRPSVGAEDEDGSFYLYGDASYDPTKNVQDLINSVKSPKYKSKQIFCQLDILKQRGDSYEWRESGRWVKYEETVEEGGKRWSKPHVASLSMHYIMELRKCLLEGVFIKDVECYSRSQIIDKFIEEWVEKGQLEPMLRQHMKGVMLHNHRHRHERGRPEDKRRASRRASGSGGDMLQVPGAEGGMSKTQSAISLSSNFGSELSLENMDTEQNGSKKLNERFLRKVPKGSEACNILVGEVEDLEVGLVGFMRLNDARELDITAVPLPNRFIVYFLGPQGSLVHLKEMGRCMATMLVDEIFREVAYKSRTVEDLLAGVDEFLEQVTVLPPGEWDPKIRIEPPTMVPSQETRKTESLADLMAKKHGQGEAHESHDDPDLRMNFIPFTGLVKDIRRKVPFYLSDFKDAIHIQCLPSMLFIFLATLTNNVTFGALLGQGTGDYMGVMECVFAGAVSSIVFALFSGQPLNILGSTGPMLVLEQIIFDLCKDNDWDFLSVRFWVGIWTTGFLLIMVVFNLSALVRYLTRFTEESFACLIALIFIYESFKKLAEIADEDPMRLHADKNVAYFPVCSCSPFVPPSNVTTTTTATTLAPTTTTTLASTTPLVINGTSFANATNETCFRVLGGTWECHNPYVPDVFLMSLLLFFLTFCIAMFLVRFRNWPCFPTFVRQIIGDFSILIAILICVGIDAAVGVPTPKLTVPSEFKPTRSEVRGWIVEPLSSSNPWWLYVAAGVPALLATILIFMDQQITAVIVNRKEHKLVKGKGYHLDLLVVSVLVAVHSLLGLPWYVAATVNAIAHVNSLKKESECSAPGEKPTFLGCREQRVTALFVGILSAAAVFITNILKVIPMPVLYGVFFYMGWSALGGMQLIDRLLLLFMPVKYQPDYIYLRHVPLWRVHVFTFIQVLCLAALWAVKSIKVISIVFPLLVVFTGVVRKIIECVFTQKELMYIDNLLPSRQSKDDHHKNTDDETANVSPSSARSAENGQNGKASFFINDESNDNTATRTSNNNQAFINNGFDNTKL
ncbi:electrogenic sodium bicarbonate cotransporter 1-like isoform X2 [Babylonia areolata]|uniref:electrogenic sodium bicarbonate cotransporter 1-like isoform X2 n=1 Tax=Babylonia areolata TaxID=304850 RepID=UPI003FD0E8D1